MAARAPATLTVQEDGRTFRETQDFLPWRRWREAKQHRFVYVRESCSAEYVFKFNEAAAAAGADGARAMGSHALSKGIVAVAKDVDAGRYLLQFPSQADMASWEETLLSACPCVAAFEVASREEGCLLDRARGSLLYAHEITAEAIITRSETKVPFLPLAEMVEGLKQAREIERGLQGATILRGRYACITTAHRRGLHVLFAPTPAICELPGPAFEHEVLLRARDVLQLRGDEVLLVKVLTGADASRRAVLLRVPPLPHDRCEVIARFLRQRPNLEHLSGYPVEAIHQNIYYDIRLRRAVALLDGKYPQSQHDFSTKAFQGVATAAADIVALHKELAGNLALPSDDLRPLDPRLTALAAGGDKAVKWSGWDLTAAALSDSAPEPSKLVRWVAGDEVRAKPATVPAPDPVAEPKQVPVIETKRMVVDETQVQQQQQPQARGAEVAKEAKLARDIPAPAGDTLPPYPDEAGLVDLHKLHAREWGTPPVSFRSLVGEYKKILYDSAMKNTPPPVRPPTAIAQPREPAYTPKLAPHPVFGLNRTASHKPPPTAPPTTRPPAPPPTAVAIRPTEPPGVVPVPRPTAPPEGGPRPTPLREAAFHSTAPEIKVGHPYASRSRPAEEQSGSERPATTSRSKALPPIGFLPAPQPKGSGRHVLAAPIVPVKRERTDPTSALPQPPSKRMAMAVAGVKKATPVSRAPPTPEVPEVQASYAKRLEALAKGTQASLKRSVIEELAEAALEHARRPNDILNALEQRLRLERDPKVTLALWYIIDAIAKDGRFPGGHNPFLRVLRPRLEEMAARYLPVHLDSSKRTQCVRLVATWNGMVDEPMVTAILRSVENAPDTP